MILISTALFCEAKPLINHFKLKKDKNSKIYSNDSIMLVITNIGKNSHQIIQQILEDKAISSFLNIGIAGHKSYNIGSLFLAHKISSPENKKSFYPIILFDYKDTENLISQNKIESDFEKDTLYDMEAFFQFEIVSKSMPVELMHCIKIVSDNKIKKAKTITAKDVSDLIYQNIPKIEHVIEKIKRISELREQENNFDDLCNTIFEAIHFTSTQKCELKDLLNRLKNLKQIPDTSLIELKTAKNILQTIKQKITTF